MYVNYIVLIVVVSVCFKVNGIVSFPRLLIVVVIIFSDYFCVTVIKFIICSFVVFYETISLFIFIVV